MSEPQLCRPVIERQTGVVRVMYVAKDLDLLAREGLMTEVIRLRVGIRAHGDSSGHGFCWHHPLVRGPLSEPVEPELAVPPWPRFLLGHVYYRESLDRELPDAPVCDQEFES